jgi:Reverse transcriptase (RNA-dependent DNA polymerase)
LGYCQHQKGYKCLHIPTNKIYISRNVWFDETSFPFTSTKPSPLPSSFPDFLDITTLPLLPTSSSHYSRNDSSNLQPAFASSTPLPAVQNQLHTSLDSSLSAPPLDTNATLPAAAHPPLQVYQRRSKPPITPSAAPQLPPLTPLLSPSVHPMITRSRARNTQQHETLLTTKHPLPSTLLIEPTSFAAANKLPEWCEAMSLELNALTKNGTWILVPSNPNQNVIGCKWIYKIKRHVDGSIERYKARLVTKGYNQEAGIDYETFSPVVKPTTIRVVLSLATSKNWSIRQLDVNNVFLHGDLEEQVFMFQPPGFVDSSFPNHVCLLKNALYGLKQAPRAWFHKLASALSTLGFKASQSDSSLFIHGNTSSIIMVLVYVDDIIVTGSDVNEVNSLISSLASQFSLKDLDPLHYFLGIQVTSQSDGIHISQLQYIRDLLIRAKMDGAKPCSTPFSTGDPLSKFDGNPMADPHTYRSIVGALQYATITRPDISYAVNKASQFMHSPTDEHWNGVKHILRYLKGTLSYGLHIRVNSSFDLHAYSDADWAGCPDDRRSTSGFCVFLGSNLLSWGSKKQTTVSRSSTEAEYRSMAGACTELIWLQQLLHELQVPLVKNPVLWCDNLGATFLASNPVFHARTKHIEIDYHFIREKVVNKQLDVRFISSKDQLADIFTKSLSSTRFTFLRNKLTLSLVPGSA